MSLDPRTGILESVKTPVQPISFDEVRKDHDHPIPEWLVEMLNAAIRKNFNAEGQFSKIGLGEIKGAIHATKLPSEGYQRVNEWQATCEKFFFAGNHFTALARYYAPAGWTVRLADVTRNIVFAQS